MLHLKIFINFRISISENFGFARCLVQNILEQTVLTFPGTLTQAASKQMAYQSNPGGRLSMSYSVCAVVCSNIPIIHACTLKKTIFLSNFIKYFFLLSASWNVVILC
jgi:hypothetical protein